MMGRPGTVLGTAAYMSPEQARGEAVDRRTDIWAFGCILYECLAGRRAFEGKTATETIAAILKNDPDWEALPPSTPPNTRFVLHRCLDKDMTRRFHHAADLRIEIEEALDLGEAEAGIERIHTAAAAKRHWLWPAWLAAAACLLVVLGFAWLWFSNRSTSEARPIKLSILPPEKATFGYSLLFTPFAMSPDGRRLAFVANNGDKDQLFVRSLDEIEARALPGTDGASAPFWSPDNRYIGFFNGERVMKVEVSSGLTQAICEQGQFWTGSWNHAGEIIFDGNTYGLKRLSAEGNVSVLTTADVTRREADHLYPCFLPDGQHFIYYVASQQKEVAGTYLGSLKGDVKRLLIRDAARALYTESGSGGGYLIFEQGESLLAQLFNARQLKLAGDPFPVAKRARSFSASHNGVLVFDSNVNRDPPQCVWMDRKGHPAGRPGIEAGFTGPQLSPDGTRVASDRIAGMSADIWIYDARSGHPSRLTFVPAIDNSPVWSPDGSQIIFKSNRAGEVFNLYQMPASGGGNEKLLLRSSERKVPTCWSSDGRFLLYDVEDPRTGSDIWVLPLDRRQKPFPLLNTEASEAAGQVSSDGLWLAYQSDESGSNEIYVQRFPAGGGKRQVSTGGGAKPQWRPDGRELFYCGEGKLMSAQVKAGSAAEISFEPGIALFDYLKPTDPYKYYAVTADGQRFLIRMQQEKGSQAPLTVFINWASLDPLHAGADFRY